MKRGIIKWGVTLGAALLLLCIAGLLAERYYLQPLLVKTLKKSVEEASEGMYQLKFENLTYEPFSGNATLSGIQLIPDTLLYNKQINNSSTSNFVYIAYIQKILLVNIRLFKLIFKRNLEIDLLQFNKPAIEVTQHKQSKQVPKPPVSPYKVISKFVKSFRVKKVEFNQMEFTFVDETKHRPQRIILNKLNIDITDFLIDSLSHLDSSRFYYSKNTAFELSKLSFPSISPLHDFRLDTVSFSSKGKQIQVKGIHYIPKFKGRQFTAKADGGDRIAFVFEDILVTQVDLNALVFDKKLIAHRANIKHGNINVFGDGTYPTLHSKVGTYPQQIFRKLPFKMKLDTVNVENFFIAYSEYNPDTQSSEDVSFTSTKGNLFNMTNDTLPLLKNPICAAYFESLFMGVARLKAHFTFNIASHRGDFTCNGILGGIDLKHISPITEALALTKIQSGKVKSFRFNMKGNEYNIRGQGTLVYNDLKIVFLKKDKDGEIKKRKWVTNLADVFFIQDQNPWPNEPVRAGKIEYTRNPKKSYFGTLWLSIRQVLLRCVVKRKGLKQLNKIGQN